MLKQTLDAPLAHAVASGDVPGVAAIVVRGTDILYEGAAGASCVGGAPMTVDTVVWIASMTKAITGAGAMQLVEQGKLDLDAPASRWAPELATVRVLEGFDASGAPRMRAAKSPITLRHLLTHTAGFGYPIWNEALAKYHETQSLPLTSTCRNEALAAPLLFDPGTRWNYGINLDWVGKLIEAVSGQRLGEYLRQHIFEPLGMSDTGFKITPSMRQRLAKVHERSGDGRLRAIDFEIEQNPEFEMGGGGLYSTANDYAKFVSMILARGKVGATRVLAAQTIDLMSRNHIGDLRVTALHTLLPARSSDAEFFNGMPKTWGLSFMINEQAAPTGRSAGSLAWAGLPNTYFWVDRVKGIGGVWLTQLFPFADARALESFLSFEKAVYECAP